MHDLSRRDFVALSVAAGVAGAATPSAAALAVVEEAVTIKTPDAVTHTAFIHPATGTHPGLLIWTDAFGLRPLVAGRHPPDRDADDAATA